MMLFVFFFFFSSRRRHTRCSRDWSSDVCSSDLIVAGIVMLRWGILATLIWHYTVDASLVGLFLLRSNSLYFKVSGAVVAAAAFAPLLFAGVSCLVRGGFEAEIGRASCRERV